MKINKSETRDTLKNKIKYHIISIISSYCDKLSLRYSNS
jgi:hypothetical protein